jgi:hypothetical protein
MKMMEESIQNDNRGYQGKGIELKQEILVLSNFQYDKKYMLNVVHDENQERG